MEDLLTSLVFGTLQRLDPEITAQFIRQSRCPDGSMPFASLPRVAKAEFGFWKWLSFEGCIGCEPDVMIALTSADGRTTHVLVEMKYHSGKSSFDDGKRPTDTSEAIPARDQLAREWQNLACMAGAHDAWVLYVTPDFAMPEADIQEAQKELREKGSTPGQIAWVSIRDLSPIANRSDDPWLSALGKAMTHLGLVAFEGISVPRGYRVDWRFAPNWDWRGKSPRLEWSYDMTGSKWQWMPRPRNGGDTWKFHQQ